MKAPFPCQHVWVGASQAEMEDGLTCRRCRECGARERRLVLPYVPPGANAIHRMHHHQVAAIRRQLRADMGYLLIEAGAVGPPLERARVTLDFSWADKRRHDVDNAAAGFKAGIDSLVGRWIVDDDAEHVEIVARGHTGTGRSCVVVTCEAMDRAPR